MIWKRIGVAALLLLVATPLLQSATLAPGSNLVVPTGPDDLSDTTLVTQIVVPYIGKNALGEPRFTATLTETVRRVNAGHPGAGTLVFTYLVPQALLFIPLFQVVATMGLSDTLGGLILVYPTITLPFFISVKSDVSTR